MNFCQIKRGIFSLRECGQAASDICTGCGTGLCQEHIAYSLGQVYCPTCQTNRQDGAMRPTEEDSTQPADWQKPGWSQQWRNTYYRESSYHPFLYGWNRDYYNDSDRSGFQSRADGGSLGDDDEPAGFSDS